MYRKKFRIFSLPSQKPAGVKLVSGSHGLIRLALLDLSLFSLSSRRSFLKAGMLRLLLLLRSLAGDIQAVYVTLGKVSTENCPHHRHHLRTTRGQICLKGQTCCVSAAMCSGFFSILFLTGIRVKGLEIVATDSFTRVCIRRANRIKSSRDLGKKVFPRPSRLLTTTEAPLLMSGIVIHTVHTHRSRSSYRMVQR